MKILLVEDHAALAQMSCRLLRDVYGHEVEHAATGAGALQALASFKAELVLVDIHLPDMNGFELARQLRADPERQNTILVALTGFGGFIDDANAAAAGFDAHFRKPMDFEKLTTLKREPGAPPRSQEGRHG